jgi:hypothetical protein
VQRKTSTFKALPQISVSGHVYETGLVAAVVGPSHFLGALGIPCAVAGILLLGLATWNTRRGVALTSLAMASIGLLGPVITKLATGGIHDIGLAERLMEYPVIAWMALIGLLLFRACRQPRQPIEDEARKLVAGSVRRV